MVLSNESGSRLTVCSLSLGRETHDDATEVLPLVDLVVPCGESVFFLMDCVDIYVSLIKLF